MNKNEALWILAEQRHGELQSVSFELLARGLELAKQRQLRLNAVVIGSNLTDDVLRGLIDRGADRVIAVDAPELAEFNLELYAANLLDLLRREMPEIVIAGATSSGRTLLPYVAMTLHAGLTADCTELSIEPSTGLLLQTRPAIGGNIMATIKCPRHRPQMATVRPKSCRPAPVQSGRQGEIVRLTSVASSCQISCTGFQLSDDDCGIQNAETVVVVGRGIKKAENLSLVRELATVMGAALGASREVVDRGWLSYPHQIGLSGKTITPKLYIGLGVSGSIQHLAGMQTAATIVAVNTDPEAQIFHVADFGIVGSLIEVVPVLIRSIKEGKTPWQR